MSSCRVLYFIRKGENETAFAIEYSLGNGKQFIKKEHKQTGICLLINVNYSGFPFRFHALRFLRFLIFSSRLVKVLTWMDDCSEQEGQGVTRTKRLASFRCIISGV